MNYRHLFHAGNFADVFKHIILVGLIHSLCRKENPFCYLDTHAGIGSYDLQSAEAQKTKEFSQGIAKLLMQPEIKMPPWVIEYLKIVKSINIANEGSTLLHYYPGSPRIIRDCLRTHDRMILSELHHQDVILLKQEFKNDKQVAVHHMDGYQALKAFLPPKERRGLVLIDPAYEGDNEFEHIISGVKIALQKWSTGIYAIWYPIKDINSIHNFYSHLRYSGAEKILLSELHIQNVISSELSACGLIVINPPWKFDKEADLTLKWLQPVLSLEGRGSYKTQWLVGK